MIRVLLNWLYAATLYVERDSPARRAHGAAKLASALLVFVAALASDSPVQLALLMVFPALVSAMDRDPRMLYYAVRAPLIPLLAVSLLTAALHPAGFFTPASLKYAVVLGLRLLVIASTLIVTMNVTHPHQLSSILSVLRAPLWLVEALESTWRLVPVTLRDADEALASARLKGLRPWAALTPLTAAALLRARSMAESLYIRGAGAGRRKTLRGPGRLGEAIPIVLASIILCIPILV